MPITVPPKVQVTIDGSDIRVKGPKGELASTMPPEMIMSLDGATLTVSRPSEARRHRELHGLTRSLVNNMVVGVNTGFRKTLIIEGVGYRAEQAGKNLMMFLGYSHPIEVVAEGSIAFTIEEKGRILHIDGIDKTQLGQVAADIRALRPPEPYKGKGIRYSDETIRRKAGKAGKGK